MSAPDLSIASFNTNDVNDKFTFIAGRIQRLDSSGNIRSITLTSLPIYSTNAAAKAGGLTSGALYRTGGDPDVLAIVH